MKETSNIYSFPTKTGTRLTSEEEHEINMAFKVPEELMAVHEVAWLQAFLNILPEDWEAYRDFRKPVPEVSRALLSDVAHYAVWIGSLLSMGIDVRYFKLQSRYKDPVKFRMALDVVRIKPEAWLSRTVPRHQFKWLLQYARANPYVMA